MRDTLIAYGELMDQRCHTFHEQQNSSSHTYYILYKIRKRTFVKMLSNDNLLHNVQNKINTT